MSITATAAVLPGVGEDFEFQEVVLDEPRPDEVLVRMVAVGLCGTDVGVQAGHIPFPLPGVLGHEGAGVVERVGAAVSSVRPGDEVLLSFTSCGSCRNCRTGHPAYCETFLSRNLLGGQRADGSTTLSGPSGDLHGHFFAQSSFATHALADERSATKVGPGADLARLAPLGVCATAGAPPAGSTVEVDANFLLNGRQLIGVTEGDSTPQLFLPALVDLIEQGRFPLRKLVRPYEFTAINDAAAAVGDGSVLKPVLTFDRA